MWNRSGADQFRNARRNSDPQNARIRHNKGGKVIIRYGNLDAISGLEKTWGMCNFLYMAIDKKTDISYTGVERVLLKISA